MNFGETISEIVKLEHFKNSHCPQCKESFRYHVLQIYVNCPNCDSQIKMRSFGGIGTEIQDVIDAVLLWAGKGENLTAVMNRHKIILENAREELIS